jgi:predicted RNA methylase
MKFGKIFLKKDLSQYYTPLPIVTFISKILDVKPNQYVIDPAGGSADFLVGVLEKYKENVDKYRDQLFYWDASEDACKVAYMNMVLHGDGRSKIIEKDSIEEHEEMNKKFDFVITNPPFGNSTVWNKDKKILENYSLSKFTKEPGVLYMSELAINNSVTLQELSNRGIKISVENRRSIEIESSLEYYYIDISNVSRGDYSLDNMKKGWEVKNIDRARQSY